MQRERIGRDASDGQQPAGARSSRRRDLATAEARHLPDRPTTGHPPDGRMDREGDDPHHRRHRCLRGGTPGASLGLSSCLRCRHLQDLPLHRQLLRDRGSANRARRPATVPGDISAVARAVPAPARRRRRNQPPLRDDDPTVVLTRTDPRRAESGPPGRPLRRRPRRNLPLRGDTYKSGCAPARGRPLKLSVNEALTGSCAAPSRGPARRSARRSAPGTRAARGSRRGSHPRGSAGAAFFGEMNAETRTPGSMTTRVTRRCDARGASRASSLVGDPHGVLFGEPAHRLGGVERPASQVGAQCALYDLGVGRLSGGLHRAAGILQQGSIDIHRPDRSGC